MKTFSTVWIACMAAAAGAAPRQKLGRIYESEGGGAEETFLTRKQDFDRLCSFSDCGDCGEMDEQDYLLITGACNEGRMSLRLGLSLHRRLTF